MRCFDNFLEVDAIFNQPLIRPNEEHGVDVVVDVDVGMKPEPDACQTSNHFQKKFSTFGGLVVASDPRTSVESKFVNVFAFYNNSSLQFNSYNKLMQQNSIKVQIIL